MCTRALSVLSRQRRDFCISKGLFDRLRRSGPVVVHIMADHDYWQMF